jgi:hypothetical protein
MSRVNAAWHRTHLMPRSATMAQRVKWHVAHARTCGCREIPSTVVTELRARGVTIPRRAGGRRTDQR